MSLDEAKSQFAAVQAELAEFALFMFGEVSETEDDEV